MTHRGTAHIQNAAKKPVRNPVSDSKPRRFLNKQREQTLICPLANYYSDLPFGSVTNRRKRLQSRDPPPEAIRLQTNRDELEKVVIYFSSILAFKVINVNYLHL